MVADDEDDAFFLASELLSFLPDHNDAVPPIEETADPENRLNPKLAEIVPRQSKQAIRYGKGD